MHFSACINGRKPTYRYRYAIRFRDMPEQYVILSLRRISTRIDGSADPVWEHAYDVSLRTRS